MPIHADTVLKRSKIVSLDGVTFILVVERDQQGNLLMSYATALRDDKVKDGTSKDN